MTHSCHRCGQCCREEFCDLALTMLELRANQRPPCPALEQDAGWFACGLVLHPQKYINLGPIRDWKDEWLGRYFEQILRIGQGCDMDGTWTETEKILEVRKEYP